MNQPAVEAPPCLSIRQIESDTRFITTQAVLINNDAPPDKQFILPAGTRVEFIDWGAYIKNGITTFGIRVAPINCNTKYLDSFTIPMGVIKLVLPSSD